MTISIRTFRRLGLATAAGLTIFAAAICNAQEDVPAASTAAANQTDPAEAQANVEVLTSGPVHEAFANPLSLHTDDGLVISKEPPEPIDELPPEAMPQGQNVRWIPGYWGWNGDADDFIWVSGLWRNIPPDQRWVPGYWAGVDSGFRWVSGFWTAASSQNLDYLPYPPASQENGPNAPAPGEGYFWIPGSWVYTSGDYRWRPGYWGQAYDDWCWVPQRYVWTPRGALYSPGYWDYRIPYRGTLFAPIHLSDYSIFRGGRRFTPGYVINPAGLLVSLFVRPQYGHYYFGNYYGDEYYSRGYRPWYDPFYGGTYRYDPLLAFYESYYDRRGVDFSGRVGQWFNFYERNPDRRPARTWRESVQLANRTDADLETTIRLAQPLEQFVQGTDRIDRNFRRLTNQQRTEIAQVSDDFRDLIENRGRVEQAVADGRPARDAQDRPGEARPDDDRSPAGEEAQRPDAQRPDAQTPGAVGRDRPRQEERADRPRRDNAPSLQLPRIERPRQEIPGESADRVPRRDDDAGASERNPTTTPGQESPSETPGQERPSESQQQRPETDRSDDASRRQRRQVRPPQRPQAPQSDANRRNRDVDPDNRERTRGQDSQSRTRPDAGGRPARNIFQPRRGEFPEPRSGGINRGSRPQIDPRDAIPQFRGRGNAAPNQGRGSDARQGRTRPASPPAANRNRGAATPGGQRNPNAANRDDG